MLFHDAHPGFVDSRGNSADPLRSQVMVNDATLEKFFQRPIRVATYTWGVNSDFFQDFDPWTLFWEDPRVVNRITNYKLLKCKMKVKFMINGNGFYQGRLICSYKPLPLDDTMSLNRAPFRQDLVGVSQLPHIYLNPTTSQGGELDLPFFTYNNVLDIVSGDWDRMGTINIRSLQNLVHANGGTTPITISVFAWAEDVMFSVPTAFDPSSLTPQSLDEYGRGPVSLPASLIAKAAHSLSNAPVIGKYMRATEIGAGAASKMATLFGFSKPADLDSKLVVPMAKHQYATTVGEDKVSKLTVDPKQELSVDPAISGVSSKDEMVIAEIAQKEAWIASFNWSTSDSTDQLLWNAYVDPGLAQRDSLGAFHIPPCAFATLPFKYWKGTMRFRFQIVCSAFHRGRIRIVFDPSGTPPVNAGVSTAQFNTAYQAVIDIGETQDFVFEAGWGQERPYATTLIPNYSAAQIPDDIGMSPDNALVPPSGRGNGTIAVYVVNDLTTPDADEAQSIGINVFLSAGPDFEVAQPDESVLRQVRFRSADQVNAVMVPQSDDVVIESPETLYRAAGTTDTSDMINRVHFGESIGSFRNLVKRYNLHEVMYIRSTGTNAHFKVIRQHFPSQAGYTNSDPIDYYIYTLANTKKYTYVNSTLLTYLTPAFAGWRGGIRYSLDCTEDQTSSQRETYSVSRLPPTGASFDASTTSGYPGLIAQSLATYQGAQGINGITRWSKLYNPIHSFELPYYSEYRFVPAKRYSEPSEVDPYQPSWQLNTTNLSALAGQFQRLYVYVAAAEDFNLLFFTGLPPFYMEAAIPSS